LTLCVAAVLTLGGASFLGQTPDQHSKDRTLAHGAASTDQLADRYFAAIKKKDLKSAYALVYWKTVDKHSEDLARNSIKSDMESLVSSVKVVPFKHNEKLQYSIKGVVYRPTLPPVGRLFITYTPNSASETRITSTSYLVGKSGGSYWITLASAVKQKK